MNSYIDKPLTIKKSALFSNDKIFSPSRHQRLIIKNNNIDVLSNLVKVGKTNLNTKNNKGYYQYIEIGDINTTTGGVEHKTVKSIDISSSSVSKIQKDDILISTVRTYLGGIGLVTSLDKSLVATKALIVLREMKKGISKHYLFGIMRSRFFIDQVSMILNASMYPRMEKSYFDKLIIPFPTQKQNANPKHVERLVSLITQNIIDKEEQIKLKSKLINQQIEEELRGNQKSQSVPYSYPRLSDLKKQNRLDTGLYERSFKLNNSLIENYSSGYFQISVDKFKSGSTPKVRIFNGVKHNYKWVTPTDIEDVGFYKPLEKISMPTAFNLKKDAILFINRTSRGKKGEYVGISCFYDYEYYKQGHHNQGIYRIEGFSKDEKLFIVAFMNSTLMRKICGNATIGSKMKEMKSYDFSKLIFPKFPKKKQKEIAKNYYNKVDAPSKLSLDNYLAEQKKRNQKTGIFQLNMEIFELKEKLDELVDKIVMDEKIEIEHYLST
ncbi:hypothetical protein H7F13_01685 [Proteus vulgaris]|uniref:hypothetical protein n=1 Tax=Proteus faecis TaxID=2050967 RepID=UPI00163CBAC1|nr:hypothetical protein [Proteus faecis]QNH66051.1 hypothetical protein H7F13_01685 [Proteus vulgaris]